MDKTQEEIDAIKQRGIEAEGFKRSELYQRLMEYLEERKAEAVTSILTNSRKESQKSLSRMEFVERQCGYILALNELPYFFDTEALKLKDILRLEKDGRSNTSTSQEWRRHIQARKLEPGRTPIGRLAVFYTAAADWSFTWASV